MKKTSEMTKEEFIDYRVTEKGSSLDEIKSIWDRFEKEFSNKGCSGQDLIDRVKRRITSYFIQIDKNPSEEIEAILIGVTETDFGAKNQYKKAIEAFKTNPEAAISQGLVTEDGQPIAQNGIAKGAPINLDKALQRTYMGLFKTKHDVNYVKGILNCRADYFNKIPQLFSVLKFRASKSKNSNDENYVFSTTSLTDFITIKELNNAETEMLLQQNYKDHLKSISDLKQYAEENIGKFDYFSIIKGDVYQLIDDENRTKVDMVTGKTIIKNTMLGINKRDEEESAVVCYGNPAFKFNFTENAQDVIVIGQPRINKTTQEITVVLYGVFAPETFRVKEKSTFIEPKKSEDEVEEEW